MRARTTVCLLPAAVVCPETGLLLWAMAAPVQRKPKSKPDPTAAGSGVAAKTSKGTRSSPLSPPRTSTWPAGAKASDRDGVTRDIGSRTGYGATSSRKRSKPHNDDDDDDDEELDGDDDDEDDDDEDDDEVDSTEEEETRGAQRRRGSATRQCVVRGQVIHISPAVAAAAEKVLAELDALAKRRPLLSYIRQTDTRDARLGKEAIADSAADAVTGAVGGTATADGKAVAGTAASAKATGATAAMGSAKSGDAALTTGKGVKGAKAAAGSNAAASAKKAVGASVVSGVQPDGASAASPNPLDGASQPEAAGASAKRPGTGHAKTTATAGAKLAAASNARTAGAVTAAMGAKAPANAKAAKLAGVQAAGASSASVEATKLAIAATAAAAASGRASAAAATPTAFKPHPQRVVPPHGAVPPIVPDGATEAPLVQFAVQRRPTTGMAKAYVRKFLHAFKDHPDVQDEFFQILRQVRLCGAHARKKQEAQVSRDYPLLRVSHLLPLAVEPPRVQSVGVPELSD